MVKGAAIEEENKRKIKKIPGSPPGGELGLGLGNPLYKKVMH